MQKTYSLILIYTFCIYAKYSGKKLIWHNSSMGMISFFMLKRAKNKPLLWQIWDWGKLKAFADHKLKMA